MHTFQKEIQLRARRRGFHLITDEILNAVSQDLSKIDVGVCHIFIKHTSASLTLNENADPDVRADFESHFNQSVPERAPYYTHTMEGPDDMPAHLKAATLGFSVSIPISNGRLNLGTWQGIYLCEHRNHGGSRRVVVTAMGT